MFKRVFIAPLSIGLSIGAAVLCLVAPFPLNRKPPTTTADSFVAFSPPRATAIDPTTQAVTLKAIN